MPDEWFVHDVKSFLGKVEKVGLCLKTCDSHLVLVFFYDVKCPGCALLEDEAGEYLNTLVESGKAVLYYVDYPVHRGVERIHAFLRCIYKRNPKKFVEVLREIYANFLSGQPITEELIVKHAENVGSDEVEKEVAKVMEGRSLAKEFGAPGTPTIVVCNLIRNIGYAIFGYPGYIKLAKIIGEFYLMK